MINIVYYSTTGNVKRFMENVKPYALSMGFAINLLTVEECIKTNFKQDFHLFTPTRGFGLIPDIVQALIVSHKDQILTVAGSGNRNWGKNFCKACLTISQELNIPCLATIELSGTNKDIFLYCQALIDFLKYNRNNEKLHFIEQSDNAKEI